ncbi:hypothetical protein SAZ_28235 [Streptomyces noursei ZPM]|nr:hypothetical protein SAZ_28235 [Streptomyces noursei ZPM]EPY92406.1 hypothetical protein K530_53440 [Streptomyces noursei CCRC 11814]
MPAVRCTQSSEVVAAVGDAGESLPGYWDAFVSHTGPGVSE